MALTLSNLTDHVTHALGGSVASQLNATQIVNEAGRFLTNCRPWRWRDRAPATVQFTNSQAYALLPTDFGELVSYAPISTLGSQVLITPQDDLIFKRSLSGTAPAGVYYFSITSPGQANVTSLPGAKRMELWPTPTGLSPNPKDAVQIAYRSLWVELSGNTDEANVPLTFDTLLLACVRSFALGYDEDYAGAVPDRIEKLLQSQLFTMMVEMDGRLHPDSSRAGVAQNAGRKS